MRRVLALAAIAGALAAAASAAPRAQITVYAAASLTDVFPRIDAGERYSFGGSNTLAAQIQQGAPADVFASANMTLPNQLYGKGLCSKPVVFTRNTLVIVVPSSNPAGIHGIYDLTRSGIKLVIAGPGVPVGSYTLQILKNMNLTAAVHEERRQPGDGRPRGAREGCARRGGRRLRLCDRREDRARQGEGGQGARLGAAQGAVRGLRRGEQRQQDPRRRRSSTGCSRKPAQAKLVAAGFLPRVKKT